MSKRLIKIELNQEDAKIYAEKTLGRNKTIRKRATVIYYASKGAENIIELGKIYSCHRDYVNRTLKGYAANGFDYIYKCSRDIKHSELDRIEAELLADFEENPPLSIPEAVSRIKKDHSIEITDTPVRYWLKKMDSLSQVKTNASKSKSESPAVFSEQHSNPVIGYGSELPY